MALVAPDSQQSLEFKVGQLFIVALPSARNLRDALTNHETNHYGGVFLARRNLRNPEQVRRLNHTFRKHTREMPPIFVCLDEEGGMVTNTGHFTTPAPSAAALGAIDNIDLTRDVYLGIGEKMRALGFNTVFAPVLDVNTQEGNPVIGTRAFGSDPELVARHGAAAVEGLREAGVAAVVKHFPGHGATETDSHHTLPKVKANRDLLASRDLEPFRELFQGNDPPDFVMSAHVAYPGLDKSGVPATLSPPILRDLLRRDMGFQGTLITDAMEMKGVANEKEPVRPAIAALQAGADVLLYATDPGLAEAAYHGVLDAVKAGKISEERIAWSFDRVTSFRQRFRGQYWNTDEEADEILNIRHEPVFFQAAVDALAVEGNAGVLSDIAASKGRKLMVMPRQLDPHRDLPLRVLREQLRDRRYKVYEVSPEPTEEEIRGAKDLADVADVVIVGTASRGPMSKARKRLVSEVTKRDIMKVGVALLDPADTSDMMSANCRIKTFGFSAPHLWALAQRLLD